MKILIYTDLQATEGSERCRHDPSIPLQRYRVKKCYEEIRRIASEEGVDHLCDLGDTTDDRSFIYRATLDVVTSGLASIVEHSRGFVKLTGNHEQLLKDGRISAEGLFHPYFRHVGSGCVDVQGCLFVYVSFTEDYTQLNAWLSEIAQRERRLDPNRKIILFAHGDVKGARYASGETCDEGISLATLDLFDVALLGHVHNHQCLIKDKAWFIGSPFQQNFGEAAQQKVVAILTVDRGKLSVKFVPMLGFPEYRTVSFRDFVNVAKPDDEHLYKVVLTSIEETEKFYAHPLSFIGEAELVYSQDRGEESTSESDVIHDPRILLERYVRARPLVGLPEDLSNEIVELGMSFIQQD